MSSPLKIRVLLLLLILVLPLSQALADELIGKIVGVHDGDTLTLLTDEKTQVKVRLEGIDAPELNQAFGNASKEALSKLVFGKTVKITFNSTDQYGRTLAHIYDGNTWVNLSLVENGMAWVYVKYSHDPKLLAAEATARKERKGLWSDSQPVAPWDFRVAGRAAVAPAAPVDLTPAEVKAMYLGSKRSEVFHDPNCKSVPTIAPTNLVGYTSRDQAIAVGKRPCAICKP